MSCWTLRETASACPPVPAFLGLLWVLFHEVRENLPWVFWGESPMVQPPPPPVAPLLTSCLGFSSFACHSVVFLQGILLRKPGQQMAGLPVAVLCKQDMSPGSTVPEEVPNSGTIASFHPSHRTPACIHVPLEQGLGSHRDQGKVLPRHQTVPFVSMDRVGHGGAGRISS